MYEAAYMKFENKLGYLLGINSLIMHKSQCKIVQNFQM